MAPKVLPHPHELCHLNNTILCHAVALMLVSCCGTHVGAMRWHSLACAMTARDTLAVPRAVTQLPYRVTLLLTRVPLTGTLLPTPMIRRVPLPGIRRLASGSPRPLRMFVLSRRRVLRDIIPSSAQVGVGLISHNHH